MVSEEIVDYHKSLLRMEEMDELWEEGMKEGMEKGILSMVKNMFSNGLSMDLISKYANLPLPEVQMMLQQIKTPTHKKC